VVPLLFLRTVAFLLFSRGEIGSCENDLHFVLGLFGKRLKTQTSPSERTVRKIPVRTVFFF